MYFDIKELDRDERIITIYQPLVKGKTAAAMRYAIKNYEETGRLFAYVREFKADIVHFYSLTEFWTQRELCYKGRKFYLDGTICGRAFSFCEASGMRHIDFGVIVIDECPIKDIRYVIDCFPRSKIIVIVR